MMGSTTVHACIVIALLFALTKIDPALFWQAAPDTAYAGKRQRAVELFERGKRLEALPLLEELVQRDPKDDELVVELAASLLEHAITLKDPQVAGQERLRARALLDQAGKLGNTSPLARNLSEFLEQLPPSGAIEDFSKDPRVEEAIEAGEAAFARHDFDEALKNYSHALELQPGNYSAALFTGNTYDRANNFAPAAKWYERAIEIDRNIETAYRYYADMLAREHDLERARKMLIEAAVAEPYNRAVWRELHAWAMLSGSEIQMVYVSVPPPAARSRDGASFARNSLVSSAWEAYRTIRAEWQRGGEFRKQFPQEKSYRHSLPEEANALKSAATKLAELRANRDTAPLVAQDGAAQELLNLYDAGLIEPYVLFSLGDPGIAKDYSTYRQNNRRKLENYMDHFVAPPHAR